LRCVDSGVAGAFGEIRWAPEDSKTFNPAFDVTPASLVTGYVMDDEVIRPDQGIYNFK